MAREADDQPGVVGEAYCELERAHLRLALTEGNVTEGFRSSEDMDRRPVGDSEPMGSSEL